MTTINKKIFKAYDIRGLYPQDVNKESIREVGRALSHIFQSGKIIIAKDGRHGSDDLSLTIKESILEEGKKIGKIFEIIYVGLSTTPMFYFLVNHFKASGGAIITASHNPKEYNGVKMVTSGVVSISGKDILNIIEKNESRV